jgi:C1A family cysteine protease
MKHIYTGENKGALTRHAARAFVFFLLLGAIGQYASAGDAPGTARAGVNKEFDDFVKGPKKGKVLVDGHALGGRPDPMDWSHMKGQRPRKLGRPISLVSPVGTFTQDGDVVSDSSGTAEVPIISTETLPAETYAVSFDLRSSGKVSAVKDQSSCGACWSFATMASLESGLLTGESWDFSENNLDDTAGFDWLPCDGGNRTLSTAYLSRWSGPWTEAADPYTITTNKQSPTYPSANAQKHVQEVLFLPDRATATDNDNIKWALTTYGAVHTSIYMTESAPYYNNSTKALYYPPAQTASTNHAVTIVGWDDNYAASNFLTAPGGNGAFLIKNSWGASWGLSGYFWVSYYDKYVSNNTIYLPQSNSNYYRVYQYDPLGQTSATGYTATTAWFSNAFTAVEANTQVDAVSFYTLAPNSTYDIYVYRDMPVSSNPRSGTLVASQSGSQTYAGYHTISLNTKVPVSNGQKFTVVVRITTPGYNYPVPIEYPIAGFSSAASGAAGQSYISSAGSSWTDCSVSYNVSLKAFTSMINDATPPANIATVSDGTGADVAYVNSTTQLSANWSASSDGESGIRRYWYAIGTTAGAQNVVAWTDNATAVSVTKTGLTLTPGQAYYFTVKAENWVGLQSAVTNSNGQIVETTPPVAPTVLNDGLGDDEDWTGSVSQLSAVWLPASDPQSGISKYQYGIGTSPGAVNVVGWTDTTNTSVTHTGLTLNAGQTYFFTVKAFNGFNMQSAVINSDGQTVDNTPPSAPGSVSDGTGADAAYSNSLTQLSANWTVGNDPESDVADYLYAIGTTVGGTNVLGWTSSDGGISVTQAGLSLTDGQVYFFSVKTENDAGLLSGVTNSNGQVVDASPPPSPASVSDGTGADTDWATSLTQLSANWASSSDPQSGVSKYWYAIGTTAGATDVAAWTDNGGNTTVTRTGLTLTQGQFYYFTVKAENGSGLQSVVINSDGQRVDATAPSSPSPVNDGAGADIIYTNTASQLSANWTASGDADSGLARYWYAIGTTAGGTNTVGWTDNGTAVSVTKTGLSLSNGQPYYFTVKAENGAGLQTAAVNSNGQTVDTTPPSSIAAVRDGTGADITETGALTQLSANWDASADAQSGIARYWYAIGTTAGGTDLVGWTDNGAVTSVTRAGLSLTNGATYFFTVKAENGVGAQTAAANSNGQFVNVDLTPPTAPPAVRDGAGADTAWSGSLTQLSANWDAAADPQSGIAAYYYAIGTTAGGTNVRGWTLNNMDTSVTATGLTLTNGQAYYFTVKAENGSGLQSAAANSNGQTIDATAPSAPAGINDGTGSDLVYVNSSSQLSANWTAGADAQSGIVKYWYAVGTSAGDSDVAGWTDNGLNTSVTRSGLSLSDGQPYYFTVKAENGAGLQSGTINSDGQTADVSAPSIPAAVNDGAGADADYAPTLTQLSANWSASSDVHSGVVKYWYAIGTTAGAVNTVGWTDNGLNTSVTRTGLSLTNGQAYYFSVKVENGAGVQSPAANSDGQVTDNTPPSSPSSVSDGAAADISWSSSLTQLSANWLGSSDAQSGVAKYWYAIGTTPGATNVAGWTENGTDTWAADTGLSLTQGQVYYYTVKAENGSGLQSVAANSNGQTVDSTPPSAPAAVRDGTGADAVWAGTLDSLSANWDAAADAQSGVVKYWYAVGTTAGASDTVPWTDNGSATSVTKSGLTLSNGQIYYFSVKSENGSGLQCAPSNSNGQTVDTTPPTAPSPVNDGAGADIYYVFTNTQLSANWAASSDPESGLARYRYRIGTTAGAGDVMDWTDNGLNTSVTKTGLSLVNGGIYYFTVRAENAGGMASQAVSSNGQLVEITAPTAPSSVRDGTGSDVSYITSLAQLSANWTTASDPETGVAKYWYGIGTTAGAVDTVGWTDNGGNTYVTRTGLSLVNGATYYFTVKAENNAAMQSLVANSNGQTTDTTAPASPGAVNDGLGADISETGALNRLAANWTPATDPQSGILRYWYAVGTTPGATDVLDWANVGLSTYVIKTGLVLTNHQAYYFSVKADNGVGLQSAAANSNGQTTNRDLSAPTDISQVRDGPGSDVAWTPSPTSLQANWDDSFDPESGISSYFYAIGTSASGRDVLDWTDNGLNTSVTVSGLNLADGQKYYFLVMSQNGAAIYSNGVTSSNGQTVDTTGPQTVAQVNDGTGADAAYSSSLTQLSANWAASADPQSGLTAYYYAIGTTPGGVNVLGWTSNGLNTYVTRTGLSLSSGQIYYVSVKALNGAGTESETTISNGQTVDNSAPSAPGSVSDGLGADISFSSSTSQLSANWAASSDAQSGIARYYYAIGTTPGAVNVAGWTDNGTSTGVTRAGLSLTDGAAYYFTVKAVNGAGMESAAVNSNGQEISTVMPGEVTPVTDGAAAGVDIDYVPSLTTLSARWNASSHSSGIAAYYYGIGTTPGAIDVVGWTSTGLNTSVTRSGLSLSQGTVYYFTVKARTNQGLESSPGVSDGQRVDTIAPTGLVELTPASPLKSGAFTVRLTVTEASPLSAGPALSYQPSAGSARSLALSQVSAGVWTASGFIDSVVSSGTATFAFSAADSAGNAGTAITSGGSFLVDTCLPPASGGTAQNSDGNAVTVPAGASPSALWVEISTPSPSDTGSADSRTYDSVALRAAPLVREFTAVDAAGSGVTNFSKPVTIRLSWPDANNDGRVDGDYIREILLRLYYLNPASDKWEPVDGARRDTALNYLEAEVSHFSVYGIRSVASGDQSMGAIKAYPNPCYMSEGPVSVSGIPVDGTDPKVLIYNVAGELVRTLRQGDGIDSFNMASWDGRNSSGAKAASGLYLYLVKTDNHGTATGKFAILW